jgi:uncharacterized protein (TIGR01244 family)
VTGPHRHVLRSVSKTLGLAVLAAVALGSAALPDSVGASLIPNYHRLRPDLASGGQPTESGLRQLGDLGFRTIIDLRTPAEGTAAEEVAVKAAGLRYVSVPVTPETLARADVDAVVHLLGQSDRGPALLHCGSGNRAGGMWTLLLLAEGKAYADAEAEGRKIGLQSPAMIAAVRRVAAQDVTKR